MHIAHFIHRYPPARGGSEAYFERLSRYLVDTGDKVTVFTSNAVDLEAFWSRRGRCVPAGIAREHGVVVRRYGLMRWPGRRYLLKGLSLVPHRGWQCMTMTCNPLSPGLWRDAGQTTWDFDVVHASAFPYAWPLLCARRLAKTLHVKFLLTPFLHLGDPANPRDPVRRAYTAAPLRWLLHQADKLFAQTASERRHMLELGVAADKVVLQGLGVDPTDCTGGQRERARQSWGMRDGDVVLGHLANQSVEKGTVDLLLAAEELWRRGLPVRIVLAGPQMPNFQRFWTKLAARMGPDLPTRVKQLGVLDDEAKKDFFAGLDLFVLPSRSDSFGLVLLEAWANHVANVAYRAGGIADVIRHEHDGLLVPCGNLQSLTDTLALLVRDASLRERLAQTGQDRIRTEFTWPDKLDIVREQYRLCLNPLS